MRLRRARVAAGALALGLAAAACGSSGSSGGSSATTATAPPASTTAPAASTNTGPAGPLPALPVPIPAGTYLTTLFRPELVLNLPDGFALATGETGDALTLTTPDGLLEFIRVAGAKVLPPGATAASAATDPPADIGAWLAANTSLTIAASTPATIGDLQAKAIEAAPAGGGDAILFVTGRSSHGVPAGWKVRAITAGSGADAFVVLELAPADRFIKALTGMASVLTSVTVTPGVPTAAAPDTAGAGCSAVQSFPDLGSDHVTTPPPDSSYNSFPPTSGPHDPQWAPWGVSTVAFPPFQLIHNMEHGGIVVEYGSGIDPAPLVAWANQDPAAIVVAPFAQLGSRIAVMAWTHLMTCTAADTRALNAFRDAYRFRAPEFFPLEAYASNP